MASAFREKCAADGIAQAQIIKQSIEQFLQQKRRCSTVAVQNGRKPAAKPNFTPIFLSPRPKGSRPFFRMACFLFLFICKI